MKQTDKQITIKQKQTEILILLYRFRYLNRVQIQTILNQKYHSRVLTWLNDLKENDYIECEYDKKVASSPSVYSLAPKSRLILKDNPVVKPRLLGHIWRDRTYSDEFRDHCLLLGDRPPPLSRRTCPDLFLHLKERRRSLHPASMLYLPSGLKKCH